MQITIIMDGEPHRIAADPDTNVLSVLRGGSAPVHAACGGIGTCAKCRVLVRSSEGLAYKLACQTPVEDGMTVIVEQAAAALSIMEDGRPTCYEVDPDAPDGLGVAIDIGTTTVVCHLHRLSDGARLATASCPNPQAVFGADIVSRIHASMEGHLPAMTELIESALAKLVGQTLEKAGADGASVLRAVIAGNTVMEHIACGIEPDGMGTSPFEPLSLFGDAHAFAGICDSVYVMPCVAGYVGGDIMAGVVATGLPQRDRPCLLVDVGTCGEMVIGCGGGMIACATAAGPAFEGANIECGMPAATGAITGARVDGEGLALDVVGGGTPVGMCGSALIDLLAILLDTGVIDETGRILESSELDGWTADLVGEVGGQPAFIIPGTDDVYLTQRDVRNIQLAKAAVCAGVLTLLDAYGTEASQIEELLIAGGFGNSIDVASAARIGLFPAELADRARFVGNAAGEGAAAVLVSREARSALDRSVAVCGYLELSSSQEFSGHFVDCMGFE